MTAAAELYMEHFDQIVRGELVAKAQEGEPCFCPRIEPQYQIDWTVPREMITRQIRVHAKPYFPAYTFLHNRMVAINRARVHESENPPTRRPGEIVRVWDDGRFAVACGDGNLIAEEYDVCPALGNEQWPLYFKVGARFG
jgi:methionyl-tRNA formyltransferase